MSSDLKQHHELGWLLHPATLFYCVTNLYYFPYFAWCATSVPIVIRIVFVGGFMGGLIVHFLEYRGYLAGENMMSLPISPFRRQEGQPLWRYIPFVLIDAFVLFFGPFVSVAYQYWSFADAQPGATPMAPVQLIMLFAFGALISGLGVVSIDRDLVVPCTRQWHTEHIILHGGMAMYMLSLGGVFMRYSVERYTAELWGLSAVTILLLILVIQRDTNERQRAPEGYAGFG